MSGENYNIVSDEEEMKWFFNNVLVEPRPEESYMVCLSARSKKLTDEERAIYQLGRGEMMRTEIIRRKGGKWNFDIYKQAPYKYNCDKNAMLTKAGLSYPDKCLVCYAYVNPSDELDCVHDTFEFYNKIEHELIESFKKGSKDGVEDHLEKLPKIFEHLRSCHATHLSRRIWRDYDVDLLSTYKTDNVSRILIESMLRKEFEEKYGVRNFVIVKTSGGYHCLVKVDSIKSNPKDFIAKLTTEGEKILKGPWADEIILTEAGSQFVPLPGTLQYGNLVYVVNKDDFDE